MSWLEGWVCGERTGATRRRTRRALVGDQARQPGFPDSFDEELWRNLEETGLSRLTSTEDAGPAEAAIVLKGLAAHAAAVPIAETDLLAMWLAAKAGVAVPDTGPLTVALADAEVRDGRVGGNRARCAVAGLCAPWCSPRGRPRACISMCSTDEPTAVTHNLAGEPRGTFAFEIEAARDKLDSQIADELIAAARGHAAYR